MRTRDEYLAWAKQRALEYLDAGDQANAVAAMCSDLQAHPELGCSDTLMLLGMKYIMDGDEAGVRRWVEGFR
jgi:hypothetical protein